MTLSLDQQLLQAVRRSDGELVASLLQLGASPDATDGAGSALCAALSAAWLRGLRLLLGAGADLTVRDASGNTPLQFAVATHHEVVTLGHGDAHLESILALLAADADINVVDRDGRSILHTAVAGGSAPPAPTPHHPHTPSGSVRVLQALFQHAPQRMREQVTTRSAGKLRATPLHLAIALGDVDAVTYLIEKCPEALESDAYVEDTDNGNLVLRGNVLHLVSARAHDAMLELFATALGNTRSLRRMVNAPAGQGQGGGQGRSPLHFALAKKQQAFIAALVAGGADLAAPCVDRFGHARTAVDLFVQQVPAAVDVLGAIFDRAITGTRSALSVLVDFDIFLPKGEGGAGGLSVLNALSGTGERLGQDRLLEHPLVESYLYILWKRVQGPYLVLVTLFGMFALSLSLLVLFDLLLQNTTVHLVCMPVVLVFMAPLIVHEVGCLPKEQPWRYRVESLLKCVCFALALYACVPPAPAAAEEYAAFGVLLAWFELILLISRIPDTGFYMLMFIEVAAKYLKLLTTFFFLIFGFVVAFLAIFRKRPPFDTFLSAMMKTTVMMTNELEFSNLSIHTDPSFSQFSQISAMIVFLLFIVFVGLVLTNLFVAVAVIDVRKLHVMRKRIEFLGVYEKLLLPEVGDHRAVFSRHFGCVQTLFRFLCVALRRLFPARVAAWEFFRELQPSYKFRIQPSKAEFRFGFPESLNSALVAKADENRQRKRRLLEEVAAERRTAEDARARTVKEEEKEMQMQRLIAEISGLKRELAMVCGRESFLQK